MVRLLYPWNSLSATALWTFWTRYFLFGSRGDCPVHCKIFSTTKTYSSLVSRRTSSFREKQKHLQTLPLGTQPPLFDSHYSKGIRVEGSEMHLSTQYIVLLNNYYMQGNAVCAVRNPREGETLLLPHGTCNVLYFVVYNAHFCSYFLRKK